MKLHQHHHSNYRNLLGIFLLTCFIFAATSSHAERLYLTFQAPGTPSLQKSEVTLKLDKRDIPVAELLAVNATTRAPEALQHPAGRRHYVFVYDLVFSKPEDLILARKTTQAFLQKAPPNDLLAIATISKRGLQFQSGFTTDKQKLIGGINLVGLAQAQNVVAGPEGNFYKAQFSNREGSTSLISDEQFLENLKKTAASEDKKDKDKDWRSQFVQTLSELAYNLSVVDGKKDIVLFSPGFESEGLKLQGNEKNLQDYQDIATTGAYIPSPEEERMMEEERRRASDRESKLKSPAMQLEGIPEFVSANSCSVHILGDGKQRSFYKELALTTGGLYLNQGSDAAANISQILAADEQFFVLGFDAITEKEFKNLHIVSLESSGKKLVVPANWVAPRPYPAYTPLMRKLHLSQALYKEYEKPTNAFRFWSDFVYEQGAIRVPVFAQLSGSELLRQDVQELGLEFYAYIQDEDGTLLDFTYVPIRTDLKNKTVQDRLKKSGIKIWGILLGKTGPVTVRSILINREFGDTYTSSTKLQIQENELTTTKPFLPDTNLNWLVWPDPLGGQNKRGVMMQYPYMTGPQEFFFPNLDPKIKLGETGQVVFFRMYHLLPESKNPPIRLEFRHADGKSSEIQSFGLLHKPKTLEQGGMELFWKLTALPQGMTPGQYKLLVNLKDTARNRDINHEISMEVQ